ncbi:hypothetical protein SNEBB_010147 [Seison nebaliae]|nr:hypothetical protein SNEBB_010147 [Seison nebaliae]
MVKRVKVVILIGSDSKGTRFRPLSLDVPKPLFPIADKPIIYHIIKQVKEEIPEEELGEILLIGQYGEVERIELFIQNTSNELNISLKYLHEFTTLGTAGGIYHFREVIVDSGVQELIVINGDVCGRLPLGNMLKFHRNQFEKDEEAMGCMLTTEANESQANNYGCVVIDSETRRILHFVEKPERFLSRFINCGVYVFQIASLAENVIRILKNAYLRKKDNPLITVPETLFFESDVFNQHTGNSTHLYSFSTSDFWSQIKSPSSAIYANRYILSSTIKNEGNDKENLKLIEDVFIHPSAVVDPTAIIGPNVSIGANVIVKKGVRIRESIILRGVEIEAHSLIRCSIIGWNSHVGEWSRIEGELLTPDANRPFGKLEHLPLFNEEGILNPSVAVIGRNVRIDSFIHINNSIILPRKHITISHRNEIIL